MREFVLVEATSSPSRSARPRDVDRAGVNAVQGGGEEIDWMVAVAGGDRAAFTRLFQRYAPKIKAHLEARGATRSSTDELTQEVMLVVWRKAALYDPARGSVAAWLYTVSRNFLFTQMRAERRRQDGDLAEDAFPEPTPAPTSEQALLAAEQRRSLAASLGELPPEQRAILERAYWRGQTMQECADEQRVPVGTVKTRVRLALERLRGLMTTGSTE